MGEQDYATGWVCDDCLFLMANGDTPPEWDEDCTAAWLAEIERRAEGSEHVTLGLMYGEDGCDCTDEQIADRDYEAHGYCERMEFSWRRCDSCGSTLGGSRHAATWWLKSDV